MNGSPGAAINLRLCLRLPSPSNTLCANEGNVRRYPEVRIYLLLTYAIDDVIDETNAKLQRYVQPSTVLPKKYAESLLGSPFTGRELYDDYVLREIFIPELHEPVCRGMGSYWNAHPESTPHDQKRHATSLPAMNKETMSFEKKGYEHGRNTKHRHDRQGNSPDNNNMMKKESETSTFPTAPVTNA